MKLKRVAVVLGVSAVILAAWVMAMGCSGAGYGEKLERITLANVPVESSALIYIADEQHFFNGNGLSVTLRDYDVGLTAVKGMLKGEADIAVAAEFILVGNALSNDKVSAITCIDRGQFMYLVNRRDRGIQSVRDLRGKKIGLARQTIFEFYLGRYLDLHGMSIDDVILVDIKTPAQWADTIANGSVDAVVVFQPYANLIEASLGNNVLVWPVQSSQPLYLIVICRNDWIAQHPETVKKFLISLAQAERFMLYHPAEAGTILQKRLKIDDKYMQTALAQNEFSLSLDQSLIAAMEDETRWMMNNGITGGKAVPDFIKYIYFDGLAAVKPGAVTLVR